MFVATQQKHVAPVDEVLRCSCETVHHTTIVCHNSPTAVIVEHVVFVFSCNVSKSMIDTTSTTCFVDLAMIFEQVSVSNMQARMECSSHRDPQPFFLATPLDECAGQLEKKMHLTCQLGDPFFAEKFDLAKPSASSRNLGILYCQ